MAVEAEHLIVKDSMKEDLTARDKGYIIPESIESQMTQGAKEGNFIPEQKEGSLTRVEEGLGKNQENCA